eukprot:PLAT3313.25.p1 GENE.PLAT3313.25~~PLAT3313.25.p1  ORF type:complete len:183 (+),score=38.99 PLAT3313.25:122-670(+)
MKFAATVVLLSTFAALTAAYTSCPRRMGAASCVSTEYAGHYISSGLCRDACAFNGFGARCCQYHPITFRCERSSKSPDISAGYSSSVLVHHCGSTPAGQKAPQRLKYADICGKRCKSKGHTLGSRPWASCVATCMESFGYPVADFKVASTNDKKKSAAAASATASAAVTALAVLTGAVLLVA